MLDIKEDCDNVEINEVKRKDALHLWFECAVLLMSMVVPALLQLVMVTPYFHKSELRKIDRVLDSAFSETVDIMDILAEAVNIAELLEKADLEWAFVGGVAVGIHGFIRATEDIDIVINPQKLSQLDNLLEKHGFIINKDPITFKDGFKLYRRVKLIGDEYFILDVMLPPENFSDILNNRQEGSISGIKVFVAARKDLIKMKKGAGRNKDKVDADELEKLNVNPEVL